MANPKRNKRFQKRRADESNPAPEDRTLWYQDLTSLDPAKKNNTWAAQALFYMKRTGGSRVFLDPQKAVTYRESDILKYDEKAAKNLIDPPTEKGGGGKAEYFSSDFKTNPIYLHLKNIVKADIQKTGKDIEVNLTDKYAKTRQMEDNYKILYRNATRQLFSELAKEAGLPPLSESQDPYKWAENLMKTPDEANGSSDMVNKYVDLIKNQISDDQDLALYNELVYKGDYEMAFELGIKYYIMGLNRWQERWSDEFINDIMHFNKACGEWYTDLFTGRPIIERFVPETLFTSPFRRKDGEDIQYYWTEYSITFGDFMREMGKNLAPEKLKEVFLLFKSQGYHTVDWRDEFYNFGVSNYTRDSALVKVGKAAFLSQDLEVQMEDSNYPGASFPIKDLSWYPEVGSTQHRVEKRYNVWRWWYYIPPNFSDANANWQWQQNYIFELQKFQDQSRYGDQGRYAKSPLVIYDNSSQAAFTDIVMSFMPKINVAWHKYQNCLVNDLDATMISDEFIAGLLGAVDETNNVNTSDGKKPSGRDRDAYLQQWKMLKQGGTGFLRMIDTNGQPMMDPSKMVVSIKNNYIEKAELYINNMMMLYDMMIKSLAFSPMTAGEEVKPRTPVAALEQTLKATDSSRFFIQKAYEEFLVMYAERMVRHIINIFREKDDLRFPDRYKDFMDNVGYANGLALEGLKDIDPESIGLTVSYVDNTAKKEFVTQLAMEYVKTKELSDDFLYLIMSTDNWKYGFVLMRMAVKKRRQEMDLQRQEEMQHEAQMKEADMNIAMTLQHGKDTGKDQNILTQGKVDIMVAEALTKFKTDSQLQIGEQRNEMKQSENQQQTNLQKDQETHKNNLQQQSAIPVS